MDTLKLTLLGAAGTVTGSRFLLEQGDTRILIDCGLFQGLKANRLRNWEGLGVSPKSLTGVVLTHAHLDHSGYLPLLVKDGFRKNILSTIATRSLCQIMLPDSGHIQEEDANYANLKGFSKHEKALPLYTQKEAEESLKYFKTVPYETVTSLGDARVTFHVAGHILGAATVTVEINGKKILFSGDLGRKNDLIMRPPLPPGEVDYIVMESTYGDRLHEEGDSLNKLASIVNSTVENRGTLLIPSFAVGRAQSLVYALFKLKERGVIPQKLPIYMDSPMATDVTFLYRDFCEEHLIPQNECTNVFSTVKHVNTVEESKTLGTNRSPKIIISASGMLTGGRVLHHIKSFATHKNNQICLVGYQAEGTRGAALYSGVRSLKIHGHQVPIRAKVLYAEGFSAHADQQELLDWLGSCPRAPKKVILVHGEPSATNALQARIQESLGYAVQVPTHREVIHLDD